MDSSSGLFRRAVGPSLTATLVASARALYAGLPDPWGVAPDPSAADLLPVWLGMPARLAARLDRGAAGALHRALGTALAGMTYHIALRTHLIDEALREALGRGTRQVVLLGAGLDNRAARLAELAPLRVFEVDHPATLSYKEGRLARAGRSRPANVTVVRVDFERDELDERVLEAGLAATEPSFWIWEGVTVYLTRAAIAATLAAVARSAAPGSRIALTYARPGTIGSGAMWSAATLAARLIGEPVRGLLTEHELADELARAELTLLSDESPLDCAHRVWPTPPPGMREWERVALAEFRGAADRATGRDR
jgi:methyltransferase (TIGR00027 family)